jgi:hypothetical protein
MSSFILLFAETLKVVNKFIWDKCKSEIILIPFEPPNDDDYYQAYFEDWIESNGVLTFLAVFFKFLGEHFTNQLFGSINDILEFSPIFIWLIALLIIGAIIYSFYPISLHHEILIKRYEGLQIQKRYQRIKESITNQSENIGDDYLVSTYPTDPNYHLAPDLRKVSFFSSFQYVVSHLLVHVSVFFFSILLFALFILALTIACGSFENILPVLAATFYAQLFSIIRLVIPLVGDYIVLPTLRIFKVDPVILFAPIRSVYIYLIGIVAYSDGSYIFNARIMLFVDTLWSLSLGIFIGIADAFSRLILSLISGLFRTIVMSEPVTFPSIDRSYIAYVSMMKASHNELFDIEELGQDFPLKKGKYETLSTSGGSNEEIILNPERMPLVSKLVITKGNLTNNTSSGRLYRDKRLTAHYLIPT